MADLRISDLVTASQLKDDDYYEISQSESGTRVSYKATLLAIAVQIATMVDFTSDLNTTSKKITGAINELKQLISLIPQFSIEVVQELPTEDISDTTIYLVPAEDPEVGNYYEEYIHVNNTWELVGTTAVDLSAYYTKLEVDGLLADKLEADDFEANQTASANPITLETKQAGLAKSCVVEMNPIQDLNGYDHPWAGGAGKNKVPSIEQGAIDTSGAETTQNNRTRTGWCKATAGTTYTASVVSGVYISTVNFYDTSKNYLDRIAYTGAQSSNVVTFEAIADTAYIRIVYRSAASSTTEITPEETANAQLEAGSTATSYEPYSNICPISGRTEVSVTRTGKNLLNPSLYASYKQSDGTYRLQGNTANNIFNYIPEQFIGKQLTFSAYLDGTKETAPSNLRVRASVGGTNYEGNYINNTKGISKITFTPTSTLDYVMVSFGSSGANYFEIDWLQLEINSTNTEYEPYTTETRTHQYGQTVYGGVDDFVNGGLDNEYELFEPTIVTTVAQSSGLWYWAFSLPKTSTNPLSTNGLMSSHFNPTNQVLAIGNCYITANGTLLLCVPSDQTLNTGALVNAWLAENDLQFAYKPATPTKIQLSPEAVTLLKGLNVISTDGNKVQVEFSDIPVGDYSALLDYIKSLEARIQNLES